MLSGLWRECILLGLERFGEANQRHTYSHFRLRMNRERKDGHSWCQEIRAGKGGKTPNK